MLPGAPVELAEQHVQQIAHTLATAASQEAVIADSAKADQRRHRSGLVVELELLCRDVTVQANKTLFTDLLTHGLDA